MEFRDRTHVVPHGSDLPDHIHAFGDLLTLVNFDQLGRAGLIAEARVSGHTLGSNPQAAYVQFLERKSDFFRGMPRREQPLLLASENIRKWRIDTPRRMPRTTLEEHGVIASNSLLLEGVENGT